MINEEEEEFLEALEQALGNMSVALKKTGYTRDHIKQWKKNIFFNKKVEEINEMSIDYVEDQLIKEIREGNVNAITFYLKTKGKSRGYV